MQLYQILSRIYLILRTFEMSSFFTEQTIEVFAVIGTPARLFGRIPLIVRYIWSLFSSPWPSTPYAKQRFGRKYKWKPWLLFDARELESLEDLINVGTNEEIWIMRDSQIGACNMATVTVRHQHIRCSIS